MEGKGRNPRHITRLAPYSNLFLYLEITDISRQRKNCVWGITAFGAQTERKSTTPTTGDWANRHLKTLERDAPLNNSICAPNALKRAVSRAVRTQLFLGLDLLILIFHG
eukprot:scaffold4035_cov118-Skeletonema_dohrnii-CCMP3373.AAC.1